MHASSEAGSSTDFGASFRQKIRRAVMNQIIGDRDPNTVTSVSLLFVTDIYTQHTCEASNMQANGKLRNRVHSSVEACEIMEIREALEDFLSIPGRRSRGNVAAATPFLEKKLPGVAISEMVVRNAIVSILKNELDAEELVKFIQSERNSPSGSVEYLHVGTNNGALDYCAWSAVGSRMVVEKYGAEVGTVDSTHKTTKYNLKLFSWIVPDCTGRSRPVIFVLMQD